MLSFLDSGSQVSLIKASVAQKLIDSCNLRLRPSSLNLSSVTGNRLNVLGSIDVPFYIGRKRTVHRLIVVENDCFVGGVLLGTDFFGRCSASFKFKGDAGMCILKGIVYKFRKVVPASQGLSVKLVTEDAPVKSSFKVCTAQKTVIPPFSRVLINGKVIVSHKGSINPFVYLFDSKHMKFPNLVVASSIVVGNETCPVSLLNYGDHEITLEANQQVGTLEEFDVDCSPSPDDFVNLIGKIKQNSKISSPIKNNLLSLLHKYKAIFSTKESPLGCVKDHQGTIPTGDHPPLFTPQWRIPYHCRAEMANQVDDMLKLDVIEKSNSPWNSPVLLVRKKDGSQRFCVDLRNLNKISTKQIFPFPRIDETIESLTNSTIFSTLDCKSGFWQIPIQPNDRPKTAFTTPQGRFQYKRLPFGYVSSPSIFSSCMFQTLHKYIGVHTLIYMDDVIIHSKSVDDHLMHLEQVFQCLLEAGIKISPKKCFFFERCVKFLGHIVSANGISPDPSNSDAIRNFPTPTSIKNFRTFLGMIGFYRRFIPNFSLQASPLTNLTKNNVKFSWGPAEQKSFEFLKSVMLTPPILKFPDFDRKFYVETDASDVAIGAVLTQMHDNVPHPIAYFSRKLNACEVKYTTTEKEFMAVVKAVEHFAYYLYGRQFEVITDHSALTYIFNNPSKNGRISRWLMSLSNFDFKISHRKGKHQVLADCLSRPSVHFIGKKRIFRNKLSGVFSPENVRKEQINSNWAPIIQWLEGGPLVDPPSRCSLDKFCLLEDCLYFVSEENNEPIFRLIIPPSLIDEALYLSHDGTQACHRGFYKTCNSAKSKFFWPNMTVDIRKYIQNCEMCLRRKAGPRVQAPMGEFPPYVDLYNV